jgi:site-specific DNA-methyltransferase (cytosine-N4-specific)
MKKLMADPEGFYTPAKRPSGHDISSSFARDNGGAIPSNLLTIPNTDSNSTYLRLCKDYGLERHPARFPENLPRHFIKMLTDEGDLVVDIFAGSNTTGHVAETLDRKWLAFDLSQEYLRASALRFLEGATKIEIKDTLKSMNDPCANFKLSDHSPTLTFGKTDQ